MKPPLEVHAAPAAFAAFEKGAGGGLLVPSRVRAVNLLARGLTRCRRHGASESAPGPSGRRISLVRVQKPFPHAYSSALLDALTAEALLDWLIQLPAWKLNDGGFYRADERNLLEDEPPSLLRRVFGAAGLQRWERLASRIFGTPLVLHGALAAHRMCAGDGVGVHSDRPAPGAETHRIVVMLTRHPAPRLGGHFALFGRDDECLVYPLVQGSGIAFTLDAASRHAVTRRRAGERYSVVCSFGPSPREGRKRPRSVRVRSP